MVRDPGERLQETTNMVRAEARKAPVAFGRNQNRGRDEKSARSSSA